MRREFKMYVSIIICTYNGGENIVESIKSIVHQIYPGDGYEILVVDDGSTDNTEDIVQKIMEDSQCDLKYFKQANHGLSAARNFGIEKSDGDIIAFVDDDCIADKDWLKNLAEAYTSEDIVAVGGKVISILDTTPPKFFAGKVNDGTGFFGDFDRGEHRKAVDWIIGCNMSFKRSVFEKFGLFDTAIGRKKNLPLSYEEVDICNRISKADYKILYEPKARIYHKIHPGSLTYPWCFNNALFGGISEYRSQKKYENGDGGKENILLNSYKFMITIASFIKKRDITTLESLLNSVGHIGEKYVKISERPALISLISSSLKLFLFGKRLD